MAMRKVTRLATALSHVNPSHIGLKMFVKFKNLPHT